MKYMKMLGLLAVAAAALMAFAGTASATLTSPAGTPYSGAIKASSANSALDGSVAISCKTSHVSGEVPSAGATKGSISSLTFTECGNDTVQVLQTGTLEIKSNNEVISSGAEVTVLSHKTIFGFPVTTHCIYATSSTKVGTLTEGSNATLDIGSAPIPEVSTDGACNNDAVWTGSYSVGTPGSLDVD